MNAALTGMTNVSGSSRTTSEDEIDREKRSMHNDMECKRRVVFRERFADLRALMPHLVIERKTPKVTILLEASYLCKSLAQQDRMHKATRRALKVHQDELMDRLNQLRRSHSNSTNTY